jgi:predicted ribosome quality control (RQC) complex YloA/Tae2 family protein
VADEAHAPTRLPALPWLWGARVQRIDNPSPGLFCFSVFHQGERSVLLLWVSPQRKGVGLRDERPKGAPASSFVQRLRTKFENARLLEAHWLSTAAHQGSALALELLFGRGDQRERAIADFDRDAPNFLLMGDHGRPVGAADERAMRLRRPDKTSPFALGRGPGVPMPADPASLRELTDSLLDAGQRSAEAGLRKELRQRTQAALKRAQRKAQAIRGDLERAAESPRLRREGNLLLCHLHSVPRGAPQVHLLDESVDPPETIELKLDPARDAQQNAQLRFERARKLERGTAISGQRLGEAERNVAALAGLLQELEEATEDQLVELTARAALLGLGKLQAGPAPKRPTQQVHSPHRTFLGTGNRPILVGKGAADNDTLTLTLSRPHDHWLHARGLHGAHVIVPRERNAPLPPELLLDAAHLAAHFSAARSEASVEVQHTERRYIRKPKGAAPGAVNVDREKVLLLRIEPERLARLLAAELQAP